MLLEGTSYNDGFKLTGPFWGLPCIFRGCVQYEASLGLVSGIFWYLQLYGRRRLVIALSISSYEYKNGHNILLLELMVEVALHVHL